jgi:nitrite reductase/ring-hydroxylating ferredoxin subunit
MEAPTPEFALAGVSPTLGRRGCLFAAAIPRFWGFYDRGRVFALNNRCPHMGFPYPCLSPSLRAQRALAPDIG